MQERSSESPAHRKVKVHTSPPHFAGASRHISFALLPTETTLTAQVRSRAESRFVFVFRCPSDVGLPSPPQTPRHALLLHEGFPSHDPAYKLQVSKL